MKQEHKLVAKAKIILPAYSRVYIGISFGNIL